MKKAFAIIPIWQEDSGAKPRNAEKKGAESVEEEESGE